MPARPCPVCDAAEREVLRTQRFVVADEHPLAGGYDVVCCGRCGFVFADTRATQADYDAYYAEHSKYEDETTGTGGGTTDWDLARLDDTARDLAIALPADARILDVGCANGGLLAALRRAGFEHVAGVDPSPTCVRTACDADLDVVEGSLFALPRSLGEFDAILLSHVLEHVSDLHVAVERLLDHLAPGGCIYVEVPDASRYAECVVAPFQDFNTEHLNHFSAASLANLMGRHGLVAAERGVKTLLAPPPCPYPALYGFFRAGEFRPVEPDTALRGDTLAYIERSAEMLRRMDASVRDVIEREAEIVVWGTGQLAMKLLAETALRDAPIVAFVDSNPLSQGKRLQGVPILAPSELNGYGQPIVVTTTIHEDAIRATIRDELGLPNEIVSMRTGLECLVRGATAAR